MQDLVNIVQKGHNIHAIIYARVSCDIQEDGASLDEQVEKCLEYATERGYIVVAIYKETHSGAYYRKRPLLAEIRAKIRSGESDILLIYAIDRLTRDQIHLRIISDEIYFYKGKIECFKEPFDESPVGISIRSTLGFAAESEREKIAYRTKMGIDKRVKQGQMVGRGKPLYGYKWRDENKTSYAYNEETLVVKRIFTLFLCEVSISAIVRLLQEEGIPAPKGEMWYKSSVRDILKNPFYCGRATVLNVKFLLVEGRKSLKKVNHPDTMLLPEGTVPSIVTAEEFEIVQEMLERNEEAQENNVDTEHFLLRRGFIRCGYCGRLMQSKSPFTRKHYRPTGVKYYTSYPYYRCQSNSGALRTCPHTVTITSSIIDRAVWDYITETLENVDLSKLAILLKQNGQNSNARIEVEAIERSIQIVQKEQESLAENIVHTTGRVRELIIAELHKLDEDIEKLQQEKELALPEVRRWEAHQQEANDFLTWCGEAKGHYEEAPYQEKRAALKMLGVEVRIYIENDLVHPRYEISLRAFHPISGCIR